MKDNLAFLSGEASSSKGWENLFQVIFPPLMDPFLSIKREVSFEFSSEELD